MIDFSSQQSLALVDNERWMNSPGGQQVRRLFGYAGTGKTTLAKYLAQQARGRWLFAAYTGKAAHVLRQKGCDGASTIHSLIYRPAGESKARELMAVEEKLNALCYRPDDAPELTLIEKNEIQRLMDFRTRLMSENQPRFSLWENSPLNEQDVRGIIVDEVSMVDADLARDLESFGKKILVLGDPFQLPPVGGGGYYTNAEPDNMLTEIHRHARESGILMLATMVREGLSAKPAAYGNDCVVLRRGDTEREWMAAAVTRADQVLCGRNATRHAMNRRHRELIGKTSVGPVKDDRLVCLRNYRSLGLFNGSQWKVTDAEISLASKTAEISMVSEDLGVTTPMRFPCWLHHMVGAGSELEQVDDRRDLCEFDWSYALTVHKSQGSQWPSVVVWDESGSFPASARNRWLYTAITRAAQKLTVFV